jgi:hypothetical protein
MARAAKFAKVPHFTPYDLRHRRISLWLHAGVSPAEVAQRAGPAKTSMTFDVYSHVMTDWTELTPAELLSRCGPVVVSEAQERPRSRMVARTSDSCQGNEGSAAMPAPLNHPVVPVVEAVECCAVRPRDTGLSVIGLPAI